MNIDSLETKVCATCGEEKPIGDFWYNSSYRYHHIHCKDCQSIRNKSKKQNTKYKNTRLLKHNRLY
jgi:DNA-directed RNA polymerase subunit RPC12/RpoP